MQQSCGPRDADGSSSAAGKPASACSLHQDAAARCGTDGDATGQATGGDDAANATTVVRDPIERIEAIASLADAERWMRAAGHSRSVSVAFVGRLKALVAMEDIARVLRRAQRELLKDSP